MVELYLCQENEFFADFEKIPLSPDFSSLMRNFARKLFKNFLSGFGWIFGLSNRPADNDVIRSQFKGLLWRNNTGLILFFRPCRTDTGRDEHEGFPQFSSDGRNFLGRGNNPIKPGFLSKRCVSKNCFFNRTRNSDFPVHFFLI